MVLTLHGRLVPDPDDETLGEGFIGRCQAGSARLYGAVSRPSTASRGWRERCTRQTD
ncbi:hypothetical protein [Pseudomonas sp.]|uniref:hypothetical protein n=1 Tax=Pseudomonas sp. TaxID=306 RepID=UPI0028AD9D31|nr:hypothetical protein [Pseudomonas sp.]